MDDVEFGVRLLANTPTHEGRDPELLRRWAVAAMEFGAGSLRPLRGHDARSAAGDGCAAQGDRGEEAGGRAGHAAGVRVVESTGGLDPDRLLLARFRSKPTPTVELFTDTLALADEVVELLGWQAWFPAGSTRQAAIVHEEAHERLHHDKAKRAALKQRVGHRILGGLMPAYVAGADELAAHAAAQQALGLPRSPLLLTAALARAADFVREN
ncbi:hypothetical protein G5C51_18095 [Streptomyces sp. A7024]|uniref:Uncharacterized protein n=1 Tax=Streptomyces coryli TaxID=1128680 RepID=A0A6G4U360_9ACTN|nr:hypothetical protein [Streptomyces coryli]